MRRTVEVYREAKGLGVAAPQLSVDTNEANPDAESVRDYYRRLMAADAEAFAALLFFEQPTGRDITIYRYEWHPIGAIKPVLLGQGADQPGTDARGPGARMDRLRAEDLQGTQFRP